MRRIMLLGAAMTAALLLVCGWAAERYRGADRSDLISDRGGKMPGPDSISGSERADDGYGVCGTDELRGGDGQADALNGRQAREYRGSRMPRLFVQDQASDYGSG